MKITKDKEDYHTFAALLTIDNEAEGEGVESDVLDINALEQSERASYQARAYMKFLVDILRRRNKRFPEEH